MSELCELRRLRALEDSRLSPAKPRHAKPSKEARPPKLLYFDGIQWRAAARRAQARMGRKSMAEREKRKRWLRKPCMARLKGVFFRFLKRVWRPTNGPTVGPSFCPSVRSSAKVLSCLALSWAHWSTWGLIFKSERVDCNEVDCNEIICLFLKQNIGIFLKIRNSNYMNTYIIIVRERHSYS